MKARYSASVLGQSHWLYYLALDPGYWGTGTARRLVEYALSIHYSTTGHAKPAPSDALALGVRSTNYSALPLYLQLGFTVWGGHTDVRFRYTREEAAVVERELRDFVSLLSSPTTGDHAQRIAASEWEKRCKDHYYLNMVRLNSLQQPLTTPRDTHNFRLNESLTVSYRRIDSDGEREAVEILLRKSAMWSSNVPKLAWGAKHHGYGAFVKRVAGDTAREELVGVAVGHWEDDYDWDKTQFFVNTTFTVGKRYRRTRLEARFLEAYLRWLRAAVPDPARPAGAYFAVSPECRCRFDHDLLRLLLHHRRQQHNDFYVWAVYLNPARGECKWEFFETPAMRANPDYPGDPAEDERRSAGELQRLERALHSAEEHRTLTLLAWRRAVAEEQLDASAVVERYPELASGGENKDLAGYALVKDLSLEPSGSITQTIAAFKRTFRRLRVYFGGLWTRGISQ